MNWDGWESREEEEDGRDHDHHLWNYFKKSCYESP